ncbi:MAG: CdaR family protein [Bacteroidota bacterium]
MKKKIIEKLNRIFRSERKETNRRVFLFFLFLLISSTFWLLNALSKEYLTSFNYPIEIINYPEDKIAVGNIPDNLTIQVRGNGYILFQYKANPFLKPFTVDLESYNLRQLRRKGPYEFFILTDALKIKFQKFFSSDIEITAISPDSLYFNLAEMGEKKVPVFSNVKVNLEKQYKIKDEILIQPDSVTITGPLSILDTMNYVKTTNNVLNNVNKSIQMNVAILNYDNIEISRSIVKLLIEVEKFTEKSIKIPVEVINIPDSLTIEFFPKDVNITFMVGLSQFADIDSNSFRVVTDYQKIENNLGNKLKLNLVKHPENADNIDFNPKSISYIIRK